MKTKTLNLHSTGAPDCHMQIRKGQEGLILTFYHQQENGKGFLKVKLFMPEYGLKKIVSFMAKEYLTAVEEAFKAKIHGLRNALKYSKNKAVITYSNEN